MNAKKILLNDEKFTKVREALNEIASAVGSTMGPSGRTVLIQSENETRNYTSTKDGHSVMKDIAYADPVKNMIAMLLKDAAEKTAVMGGDSTTTTIVMIQAIIEEFDKIAPKDPMKLLREIRVLGDKLVANLGKNSTRLQKSMIQGLATTSANNDPILGKLIADLYKKVNRVYVTHSRDFETHTKIVSGILIERGLLIKKMATNSAGTLAQLVDPYIMIIDREIEDIKELEKLIREILAEERSRLGAEFSFEAMRPLLIIGNVDHGVQESLTSNHVAGKFKSCIIIPPSMGERSKEIMQDIATATGATYFSEATGDILERVTTADLGRADRVLVTQERTELFLHPSIDRAPLKARIADLKEAKSETKSHREKEQYNERINALDGGIGIIEIGAPTMAETKEIMARAEDAQMAVASALEYGVLPGGGVSYIDALTDGEGDAYEVMRAMVRKPYLTIMNNDGIDPDKWILDIGNGHAYNIRKGEVVDMLKDGIIDSTKCSQEAVTNAISVATTILSSQAIIVYDYDV